jgi:prefoldin subunit 5
VLSEGRIEALQAEHDAVDKLRAKYADAAISLTRRDPDNTGPLLVHVDNDTYVVGEDGKVTKQKGT